MVNFILQYHLLEDKSDRPYECEWCGDNFGGHKRKERQKKSIAKLDKELAKLREENRKLNCVVCDKELTGNQTLYCSDQCSRLTRLDDRKRPTPVAPFGTGNKWHEGHYGKCNIDIVESKNTLEVISLEPYTVENDYYIEKCIIEELPQARYTDGSFHTSALHKGQEYYYGPNYSEREFVKYRKKSAITNLITLLKQRIKQLEDGERKESMVIDAD